MQDWYDGFARIAWAVCYIYIIRVFSRPPFEEVVRGTTLCLCMDKYKRKDKT